MQAETAPYKSAERHQPMPDGGIIEERVRAEIGGEFVVFLIGMRINKLWEICSRTRSRIV